MHILWLPPLGGLLLSLVWEELELPSTDVLLLDLEVLGSELDPVLVGQLAGLVFEGVVEVLAALPLLILLTHLLDELDNFLVEFQEWVVGFHDVLHLGLVEEAELPRLGLAHPGALLAELSLPSR